MNTIATTIGATAFGLLANLPVTALAEPGAPLNTRVTSYAVALAGVPYRYGGTSPETGFDCSGFVGHVIMVTAGVNLPRTSHDMAMAGRPVGREELRPGDLVFHNTRGKPNSHAGIYLGDGQFIHSPKPGEVVQRASMTNPYWRARFNGGRRVIEESTQYAAMSEMPAPRQQSTQQSPAISKPLASTATPKKTQQTKPSVTARRDAKAVSGQLAATKNGVPNRHTEVRVASISN
jgi:NlpC/P60 family